MAGDNNYNGNNGYQHGQQAHNGQWRSSEQANHQSGSSFNPGFHRFSYTGGYYGFQFSGTYDAPSQANPSNGVPQSDVRSQGVGNGQAQGRNSSATYAAPSYPSPPTPNQSSTPFVYNSQSTQARPQNREAVTNAPPASYGAYNAQRQDRTLPGGKLMSGSGNPANLPSRATQTSSPAAYQQAQRAPPQHPYQQARPAQQQSHDALAAQTVDPSQFHDSYHEMQRRKAAEAEAQAKREDNTRKQAEAQRRRESEDRRRAEAARHKAEEEERVAEAKKKTEMENEMKEMFLKLRQYHEKDPELLSKMWAAERENHLAMQNSHSSPPPAPSPTPASAVAPAPSKAAPSNTKASAGKSTPKSKGTHVGRSMSGKPISKDAINSAKKAQAPERSETPGAAPSLLQTPSAPVLAQPGVAPSASRPSQPIWPAAKKATLSAAASRLIQAVPENNGRTLLPSDISLILDGNPTYPELCNAIEQRGLKINRTSLAKGLLSIVPDSSKEKPAGPAPADAPSTPVPLPPTPLTTASGNANAGSQASPAPSETPSTSKAQAKPKAKKGRAVETKFPATKEDQARKRTFNDVVDMTQDDDEDVNDPKRMHIIGETPQPGVAQWTHEPQQPPSVVKKPPTLPHDHPLKTQRPAEFLDKRDAKRRSKYSVNTIARDILLSSGRHPDMRPLNAHLDMMKGLPLQLKDDVDLSTLKWDIIDPGGVAPGHGHMDEPGLSEYEDDADDEGQMSDSDIDIMQLSGPISSAAIPAPAPLVPQAVTSSGDGDAAVVVAGPAPADPRFAPHASKSVKRRGKPSGFNGSPVTPRQHAPGSHASTPGAESAYAALRRQNEQSGGEKRRGRPVGWRKWMQKTPDGSSSAANKPARPSGLTSAKKPPPSPPDPTFPEFKCEWDGCTRSLHNLDTLRRHVQKLHSSKEGNPPLFTCKWADCGQVETVRDGVRTVSRRVHTRFAELDAWKQHIEDAHIRGVAWRLGDGPSAGLAQRSESASEQSESYLSDRDGRQLTPRIELPTRGFTAVNASAARSGRPSAIEQARETLRGAEERRNRIGYGIDHGGARSVNDEMRATLADDGDSDEPGMEVVDKANMDFAK